MKLETTAALLYSCFTFDPGEMATESPNNDLNIDIKNPLIDYRLDF